MMIPPKLMLTNCQGEASKTSGLFAGFVASSVPNAKVSERWARRSGVIHVGDMGNSDGIRLRRDPSLVLALLQLLSLAKFL